MDTLGYILLVVVALAIVFLLKSKMDEKELLHKYQYRNEKEWGQIPETSYTYEKLQSIKEYYLANQGEFDVDDITWNDVDMDTIFMLINNTKSSMGEDYLYSMLRKLSRDKKELSKREKVISFFQKNADARNTLQTEFRFMGKLKEISLYKYINRTEEIPYHSPIASIFMACALVVSIILIVLSVFTSIPAVYGVVMFVCCIINNIMHYFQRKAHIEKYYNVFQYVIRVLEGAKSLMKTDIAELSDYWKRLKEITDMFQDFERGAFIVFVDSKKGEGSFFDLFLDYFRMLFHIDLIKFDSMVRKVQSKQKELNELYEILGFLDACIAVASFRTWLGEEGYCLPDLKESEKPFIEMKDGYHPVLEEPVSNTISAKRPVLITGSNASGKSTFIKTVAINAILAQTIHTVAASSFEASFMQVCSSMALRDDLQGHESYYIVEIKSLKRILEKADSKLPMLCFVDEVLRGTNTLERIAASAQILKSFAETNTICFAATHDLELTHMLEAYYDNYHFQEQIKDDEVIFDYCLREGKAISRNAIKLLGVMGYKKEIIEKAENLANHFLESGVWDTV